MPFAWLRNFRMYYEVHGEGEPLLLIMGLGVDSSGWLFQIPAFRKHYKVITFDNRGCGKTDKPPGPYTTREMAEDTVSLLDFLEVESANVLGISMGGMVAQELAIRHPSRCRKLILACTYARPDDEVRRILSEGIKKIVGKELPLSEIDPSLIDAMTIVDFMLPLTLSKNFIDSNREAINAWISTLLKNVSVSGFLAQVQATQSHDTVERLHLIKSPTLVITGDSDKLVPPSCSTLLAEKIPGAKLLIMEGPHGFNFENRKRFNEEILRFLSG